MHDVNNEGDQKKYIGQEQYIRIKSVEIRKLGNNNNPFSIYIVKNSFKILQYKSWIKFILDSIFTTVLWPKYKERGFNIIDHR